MRIIQTTSEDKVQSLATQGKKKQKTTRKGTKKS